MRQRTAAIVGGCAALAVVGLLVLSQVVHEPMSCSASARVETIRVDLTGDVAAVHDLRLCSTAGCSLPLGIEPTVDPTTGAAQGPAFGVERVNPSEWVFAVSSPRPSRVTATAVGPDGRTLVAKAYDVRWSRAEPESACDLSLSTAPLTLAIPAA